MANTNLFSNKWNTYTTADLVSRELESNENGQVEAVAGTTENLLKAFARLLDVLVMANAITPAHILEILNSPYNVEVYKEDK